jgi:hypothetical protein
MQVDRNAESDPLFQKDLELEYDLRRSDRSVSGNPDYLIANIIFPQVRSLRRSVWLPPELGRTRKICPRRRNSEGRKAILRMLRKLLQEQEGTGIASGQDVAQDRFVSRVSEKDAGIVAQGASSVS